MILRSYLIKIQFEKKKLDLYNLDSFCYTAGIYTDASIGAL